MLRRSHLRLGLLLLVLPGCADEPPPAPPPPAPVKPPAAQNDDTGRAPTGKARPRITKLSYSPGRPTTLDHIRLDVEGEDPDGGVVRLRYSWYINGKRMLHLNRDNLPAASVERGDVVYCEVRALDDDDEEAIRKTPEIEIVNAPPTFTTDPRTVRDLDGLQLRADDPDDDKLTFSLSGAPKGMTIDPKKGRLSYKGSTEEPGGHYDLVATVSDGNGGTATWQFGIDVSAGSTASSKSKAKAKGKAKGRDGASAGAEPSGDDAPPKRERRRTAW